MQNKTKDNLIIATLILLDIALLLFSCNQIISLVLIKNFEAANTLILFITCIVLGWYTLETKKIREIEQQPIIDLYYRPEVIKSSKSEKNHPKYLRLRNSGKGTAYNIKVEKIISENGSREFEFYFEDPNLILMNDKEQTLWVQSKNNQNNASYQIKEQALEAFLSYAKEQAITKKSGVKIIVSYENYLGKEFKRTFELYCRHHLNFDELYKKEFEIEFIK